MIEQVQAIVDDLAARLGRSVAVDDPRIRLIAASRHFGDEDPVRVGSVLNRAVPPALAAEVLGHGIGMWTGPGRVPGRAQDGRHDRVVVPIRHDGRLLGFLWLIDANTDITDAEIAAAIDAAAGMAPLLADQDDHRGRRSLLLRTLLDGEPVARVETAARLAADHPAVRALVVVHVAARPPGGRLARGGPDASTLLTDVTTAASVPGPAEPPGGAERRRLTDQGDPAGPAGDGVAAARPVTRVLLGLTRADGVDPDALTARVAGVWHEANLWPRVAASGVGGGFAEARRLDGQARVTLAMAERLPGAGHLARWDRLGALALVPELAGIADWPGRDAADRLRTRGAAGDLLRTAAVYLGTAGDTAATSAQLGVHRATLYHRLRRIAELTGLDPSDGADRLTLHLSVAVHFYNEPATSATDVASGPPPRPSSAR